MDLLDVQAALQAQARGGPQPVEVGAVTSVSPLKVNGTGTDELAVAMSGYTPAVGDAAVMLRSRGLLILIGRVATGVTPPAAVPDVSTGTTEFPATYSFSWRNGSDFNYRTDVRQGAQDTAGAWSGAWFYQGTPGASLYGATVTGCRIKVKRQTGGSTGAQAAHLFQSSTGSWPIADLTAPPTTSGAATDVTLSVDESVWVTLPVSVGQALVDVDAGVMIAGTDPMVILTGTDTDPESGLLSIDWTR